jgi:hypothetical protein
MFAISSHIHHEFGEYTTQFQNKQSCQNESETVRFCHRKRPHRPPDLFEKDTRQCTTKLPIRAIPPTISHEAKHPLPADPWRGARCPPAQKSARNFPPHYQKGKSSKTNPRAATDRDPRPAKASTSEPAEREPPPQRDGGAGPELAGSYRRAAEDAATARRERGRGDEGTHRLCSKAMNGRLLGFISPPPRGPGGRRG